MKSIYASLILLITSFGISQDHFDNNEKPFYVGFGLGMDFGGYGGKLEYMFLDYAGLFTGVGYNLNGVGLNGGVMLKAAPKDKFTPYLFGTYGYTGVVIIKNASTYNMTDYGFSVGAGLEFKTKNFNVWQLGIIRPFRSEEFQDHYQSLVDNPNISIADNLPPFGISIGFKILM